MSSAATKAPKYQVVKGFKFAPGFLHVQDALEYEARADDLFIVTYPKNGTTWTQHIVTLILNEGKMPDVYYEKGIFGVSPFLEAVTKQHLIDFSRPCAIKSHLPYEMQPKHPSAKYIFVMRNAKDAAVSFYYHHKLLKMYEIQDMDFHTFFPFWLSGEVECGDYFDFVKSWWNQRNNPNILILKYEEMKVDPEGQILRIATFMGQCYADKLIANNDSLLKVIAEKSSFEKTKNLINTITVASFGEGVVTNNQFARKGIVGDWKNHLNDDEDRMIEQKFHQKFDGTGLEEQWNDYDIFSK